MILDPIVPWGMVARGNERCHQMTKMGRSPLKKDNTWQSQHVVSVLEWERSGMWVDPYVT